MSDATPFLGRQEEQGRRYPLFLERFLLLMVLVAMWLLVPTVSDTSVVLAYCGLPVVLLMAAELIGRMIQSIRSDA
ncbi:MAG: hypothetical protein CMA63_00910 [Euryarchaeota archaeon]|nr:hypothetical protein [Euryarchaeota archaeon]